MSRALVRRLPSLIVPTALLGLATLACAPTSGTASPGGAGAATTQPTPAPAASHKDISVEIEGQVVTLVGGVAETAAAPGSATKMVTRYFGNEATGDLNGDGAADIAFLITRSGGGSGTFFYVVAALRTARGYTGTNAVLLGDRIAPQTTRIDGGELVVNYADRRPGEPMTTRPSVGVSKYLKVVGGRLQVVR